MPQQSIYALFPALRQQRCDLLLLHIAAPLPNISLPYHTRRR